MITEMHGRWSRWIIVPVSLTLILLVLQAHVAAQEPPKDAAAAPKNEPPKRLVEREPFDRIKMDAANGGAVVEVQMLTERKIPAKRDGNVQVRLVKKRELLYEVPWKAIEDVEFYEEMMIKEARRLLAEGPNDPTKFNEAFEYLDKLHQDFANTPGVEEMIQDFVFDNAQKKFSEKRFGESIALLDELYHRNPNYRRGGADVVTALGRLFDRIMTITMEQQDYGTARKTLIQIRNTYGESQKRTIGQWEERLSELAAAKRDASVAEMNNGRYRQALALSKEMLHIWPSVDGGRDLADTIVKRYPLVVVGVGQGSATYDAGRIDDWGSRRAGRLVQRRLCEYIGRGPEGGRYVSPLGLLETSDDNRQLFLLLDPWCTSSGNSQVTGYDVAQRLLSLADPKDPTYFPAWGALVSAVTVDHIHRVRIDLRRSHILPESLLQMLVQTSGSAGKTSADGPYIVGGRENDDTFFTINKQYAFMQAEQPMEIVERAFEKSDKEIIALKRGDIDVIDRVFPADVQRLKSDDSISVGSYSLPSLHVIVPNFKKPFTGNRTFRRALLYMIDRETILNQEILGGFPLKSCRVISGPFPPGNGPSDALAYAYDDKLPPRVYNPRLGFTLTRIAATELGEVAKIKEEQAPVLGELVLGYPPNEVARVACDAIIQQISMTGIKVKGLEMPVDELNDPHGKCDLMYVELTICEPVVDAVRLLGRNGLLPESSPYIGLALRRLEGAKDWKTASDSLKELHRITYDDVTVLPLWQLNEHYAYRKWLNGIATNSVSLYQDVERWRLGLRSVED